MSSPLLGDSPSLPERPERKQITLKHMPLEKHNTSLSTNTPTGPNTVVLGDGDSAGHIVRAQGTSCRHQSPGGEHCNENGWGPEFFPIGEVPGTPTETNSPTRYDAFASGPQSKPQKPWGRRNARKSTQPAKKPQRSGKIQKKQSKGSQRHGNGLGTTLERSFPPGIQRGLERFQEQLRLLEEQNKRRLEAIQGEPSD